MLNQGRLDSFQNSLAKLTKHV